MGRIGRAVTLLLPAIGLALSAMQPASRAEWPPGVAIAPACKVSAPDAVAAPADGIPTVGELVRVACSTRTEPRMASGSGAQRLKRWRAWNRG